MKGHGSSVKRVLVTGAAGFVGRHCLPILLAQGFVVHAADIIVPADRPDGVLWHDVDLLNAQKAGELMAAIRPTHLLHFAWYVEPGDYWTSPENLRWLESSLHLLRCFRAAGGERVVMAGTCMEYDLKSGFCSEFTTPLAPSSLYGTCKNALQNVLRDFARETNLSSAWGRIFFLYGPYENPQRLVSSVILNLTRNKMALCTHGDQIRDFLYVKDVASAFVSLLKSDVKGPVNIASGRPKALKEIIWSIADRMGKSKLIRLGALPEKANEPPRIVGDTGRLSNEVLWKAQYDIESGILETIDWWQERLSQQVRSE